MCTYYKLRGRGDTSASKAIIRCDATCTYSPLPPVGHEAAVPLLGCGHEFRLPAVLVRQRVP